MICELLFANAVERDLEKISRLCVACVEARVVLLAARETHDFQASGCDYMIVKMMTGG